jgi:hypothetical protein
MTQNVIFNEKEWKYRILIFLIFPKSQDFAGFAMKKKRYLDKGLTYFDFKTRFGKDIKFYYEA